MEQFTLSRRLAAEAIGTAALLAVVFGSGIMGERLAGGKVAIALVGNTPPTGAILVVLILMFGPLSGPHFNPAVTPAGALIAHAMFDLPLTQVSETLRIGPAQWFSEWFATFGLVATILATLRFHPHSVAFAVGLYITAGYRFTASTSFANPAVTIARSLTNTFSGIAPAHAPAFIIAQLIGAASATLVFAWLIRPSQPGGSQARATRG